MGNRDPNPARRFPMRKIHIHFDRLAARNVSDHPELSDVYERTLLAVAKEDGAKTLIGPPERESVTTWWQRNRADVVIFGAAGAVALGTIGFVLAVRAAETPAPQPTPVEIIVPHDPTTTISPILPPGHSAPTTR